MQRSVLVKIIDKILMSDVLIITVAVMVPTLFCRRTKNVDIVHWQ